MIPAQTFTAQRTEERRRAPRQRTLLAGRLVYGDPAMTINCGIRNLGPAGALVELEGSVLLTPSVRLISARDSMAYDATIVWRRGPRLGLSFGVAHDLHHAVDPQIALLKAIWKEMALR